MSVGFRGIGQGVVPTSPKALEVGVHMLDNAVSRGTSGRRSAAATPAQVLHQGADVCSACGAVVCKAPALVAAVSMSC